MNKITKVKIGKEARRTLLNGVNAVYNIVKRTLGPAGENVMIYGTYGRDPRITNDGVRIAGCIELADENENDSAKRFVESSRKTNERVGDGTTSTIVLAGYLINEILSKDNSSSILTSNPQKPIELRKQINEAKDKVVELIKKASKKVETKEELEKIATISVEDEKLGKIVADIVWQTGVDGFVDVVEGYSEEIETEVIKGMKFRAKYASPFMITDVEHKEMILEDIPTIVTNTAIESPQMLQKILANLKKTRLVIFAPSFSKKVIEEVYKAMSQSKGQFQLFCVKCASLTTEELEDLAVYTDSRLFNKELGDNIELIQPNHLGLAYKLVVNEQEGIIIGGRGNAEQRIEVLKAELKKQKTEMFKKKIERRIASINSTVGVIKVGASTQAEIIYLKDKLEDAQYACLASLQEGYVKGGGLCLKEIAEELGEDNILYNTLQATYNQIQDNAGGELEITDDVIDPAKVVRLSVEHSMSLASSFVTLGGIVSEERERTQYDGLNEVSNELEMANKIKVREKGLKDDWEQIKNIGK
jgi:chaperonin GroEL